MEVHQEDDPYENPFKKRSLTKKLDKEKQKLNEIKNKLTAKGLNPVEFMNKKHVRKADLKARKTVT
jgi:hypothetical protein